MCGILGRVTRQPQNTAAFSSALQSLRKRGPDGFGVQEFQFNNCWTSLGHTRLAILDLSSAAAQPMLSDDGRYCIVFNGEIYNFEELKSELLERGHTFRSSSDTEVLLKAFHEFGADVVRRLDGMFAFAILDTLKESIFLARDPFGKKPLFFYWDDNQFAFASEMTALRKLDGIGERLTLNPNSILQYYIFGFVPGPSSIFKQISKFSPSCHANFDMATWNLGKMMEYWSPVNKKVSTQWNGESSLLDAIDTSLTAAVKKRLVADVPICMFLSGGVDSSIVLAKAVQLGRPLQSFSISFPGYGADESVFARRVAQHLGVRHDIIEMTASDMSTAATEMLDYLDEPIADAALLPLYHLAKQVSGGYKVALSGDGGDEIFGGYIKYKAQRAIEQIKFFRGLLGLLRYFRGLPDAYRRMGEGFSKPFARRQFIFGSGGFLPLELAEMLEWDQVDRDEIYASFEKTANEFVHLDPANRSMLLDCRYQLPDWYLVKSDRATMANSMELRSPLLDKELAELMFQVSGRVKIAHGELKSLLKTIAARYLPHDVLYRPKLGFGVDVFSWVRTEQFRALLFDTPQEIPVNRVWLENNFQSLSPLKLIRIAFLNHYVMRR